MNQCMEIQARIPDYIEGNLSPDELEEFITHIESCDECKEELNIYYTIYLGLLQLDHEDRDIKELNERIRRIVAHENELRAEIDKIIDGLIK